MASIFAAADIGSNTAHLLVAASDGDLVMRIDNVNEWIALGEMVARQGTISGEGLEMLLLAVKQFEETATARAAEGLYVFATEAMRAASNHESVLKKIKQETGVIVDLISAKREAELSMRGVRLDTKYPAVNLLFEVGGGSAQIAAIDSDGLGDEASLPLGTGRVIAEAGLRSPCPLDVYRAGQAYAERILSKCDLKVKHPVAVASGGVARGLWRALHPDGEKKLALEEISYLSWSVSRLPIDRIVERFGVKAKRAGTLLPGAIIYQALMEHFELTEVLVSEFGVREGAILEMAEGKIEACPA